MITTLWINELSKEALADVRSSRELRQASRLKYRAVSGHAVSLLEQFCCEGILRCEAEQIELRIGDKRAENGQILLLKAESILNDLVGRIGDSLWEQDDLTHLWPNPISIPRVRYYLERCIEEEIKDIAFLAAFVLWQQDQADTDMRRDILLIPVSRWGRELEPYLCGLGLEVRVFDDELDRFVTKLRRMTKTMVSGFRLILGQVLKPKRLHANTTRTLQSNMDARYKVSVPYRRSIDLDERNDLFWFRGSGLDPETIVVSFESPAYPVDSAELERLRSHGFDCVAHTENTILASSVPVWQHTCHLVTSEVARHWFAVKTAWWGWRSRKLFWQWLRLVDLMGQVNRLQDYYKTENIRVDIGLGSGKMPAIRAIAMDNIGGVRIGLQWSSFERQTSFLSKSDNVFFCWNKGLAQVICRARSCTDHLVVSGYIYDGYIDRKRLQAHQLRELLLANGAQFVVALFDQRINDMSFPIEVIEDVYRQFLNECLVDPTFGLIIKSKDSGTFCKLNEIETLLRDAKATGRCLALEDDDAIRRYQWKINNIFAIIPAMASDLTVSLSVTTTGRESALVGTPALYYDYLHLQEHPFHRDDGKGRLVFNHLHELIAAIRRYRAGELPSLGDHGSILDEIDPFRDGWAGERIGTYIRWFLERLNAGESRDEALAWANARYAAQWGADKVISTPKSEKQSV